MNGIPILLVLVVAIIGFLSWAWRTSRAQDMVDQWAATNGLQVLSRERRTFRRGPFFFRTGKGQEVYYVTAQDQAGNIRRGYVRCGGWVLGMMSDQVSVEWEQ